MVQAKSKKVKIKSVMKSIFESSEVMTAYATIDMMYICLEKLHEKVSAPEEKTSPINTAIDRAVGKRFIDDINFCEEAIEILDTIIKNKKFIEADFSNEIKRKEEVTKLLQKRQFEFLDFKSSSNPKNITQ